jgi:hypothetical protein
MIVYRSCIVYLRCIHRGTGLFRKREVARLARKRFDRTFSAFPKQPDRTAFARGSLALPPSDHIACSMFIFPTQQAKHSKCDHTAHTHKHASHSPRCSLFDAASMKCFRIARDRSFFSRSLFVLITPEINHRVRA